MIKKSYIRNTSKHDIRKIILLMEKICRQWHNGVKSFKFTSIGAYSDRIFLLYMYGYITKKAAISYIKPLFHQISDKEQYYVNTIRDLKIGQEARLYNDKKDL